MGDQTRAASLAGATIVFDLDGTIADTAGDLIAAANAALTAAGLPPASGEAIKPGVGYGTRAMLEAALNSIGHEADGERLKSLRESLVSHYENHIAEKTALFPGFLEAAIELGGEGALLALCTNKRERLAGKLLSALEVAHLFDAIAGGDTYPFHKPDPRHITSLIREAGGDPTFALMVGDSEADVAAARDAGIPCVAVRFGYAAVAAEELGADAVIGSFDDLPSLAKGLLSRRLRDGLAFEASDEEAGRGIPGRYSEIRRSVR